MTSSKHLYLVFNPDYGKNPHTGDNQVLEFYNRLKNQYLASKEKPFLYWGKIKKTLTNPPLDIKEYQDVIIANEKRNKDTYLFISDFQHFWVAKVTEITNVRPKEEDTLECYKDANVEAWFKIEEIDLLENEPSETSLRISGLSSKDHDSLNPYLGGLRYPVIVTDNLGNEDYFAYHPTINDKLVPTRMLLPNPIIESNSSRMKELITSYVMRETTFNKLPSIVRNEIITAEEIFHANPKGNIHKVALAYLQALEAILNLTLIQSIHSIVENKQRILDQLTTKDRNKGFDKHGKIKPILQSKANHDTNISINDFRKILESGFVENVVSIREHCLYIKKQAFYNFCQKELLPMLKHNPEMNCSLSEYRNHLSHPKDSSLVCPSRSEEVRSLILGVECEGLLSKIINHWVCANPKEERKTA